MTPDEFQDLCSEINEKRQEKKSDVLPGRFNNLTEAAKIPDLYAGYKEQTLNYLDGKLHAYGEFPEDLFRKIKPLQSEEEYDYIRKVYEPVTKDIFLEFANTAKKSLNNGRIEWPSLGDNESNDFKDYLTSDINNFDDIMHWAMAMVDTKILDGMGIVCAWPEDLRTDDDGILVGQINAQPLIYPVPMVVWHMKDSDGDHFVVQSKRKSTVEVGGKMRREGYVYRYISPQFLYEAEQTGEKRDNQFAIVFMLDHEVGYTPATRLKGLARLVEDSVVYDSIFSVAIPHLNNAVIDSTGLSAIKQKVMYPTRVVVREKCMHEEGGAHCEGGVIRYFEDGKDIQKTCPNCRGTGYIGVFGPMSELSINAGSQMGLDAGGPQVTAQNALAYVGPSTEIPKFTREEIEHHIRLAEKVLHLKSEPRNSGNITATEKDRDKENTEAFIKPISDQIWGLVSFVIEAMGKMMYSTETYEQIKPVIHPAQHFDILTSSEVAAMIGEARAANLPEIMITSMVDEWMGLINKNDSKASLVFELVAGSDRLLAMTQEQVQMQLSRNLVQRWEAFYHANPVYVIEATLGDNPNLFDLEMGEQIDLVRAKAQEMVPAAAQNLPPAVEPPIGG